MTLLPLPAFNDNYIWMMEDGHSAVVVDPGVARPNPGILVMHQYPISRSHAPVRMVSCLRP